MKKPTFKTVLFFAGLGCGLFALFSHPMAEPAPLTSAIVGLLFIKASEVWQAKSAG